MEDPSRSHIPHGYEAVTRVDSVAGPQCIKSCSVHPKALVMKNTKDYLQTLRNETPTEKFWRLSHATHREFVAKAQAVVDSKTPESFGCNLRGIPHYAARCVKFIKLQTENACLTQQLYNATILRIQKQEVSNRLDDITRNINNRGRQRQDQALSIAHENCYIYDRIKKAEPLLSRHEQLTWYGVMERAMESISRYPLHWKYATCDELEKKLKKAAQKVPFPLAYLTIEVENVETDNVVVQLLAQQCPWTVAHFLYICDQRENSRKKKKCGETYEDSGQVQMHRDQKGNPLYVTLGRYSRGPYSYKKQFETCPLNFDKPGVVAMFRMSHGEIMISLRELPVLNNDPNIITFGRVIQGLDHLLKVAEYPDKEVIVTYCDAVGSDSQVLKPRLLINMLKGGGKKQRNVPASPVIKMMNADEGKDGKKKKKKKNAK